MFVSGSAGSTAGGVKVAYSFVILKSTTREIHCSLHPHAVLPVRDGWQIAPDEVIRAVKAFITLCIQLFAFTTAVLA